MTLPMGKAAVETKRSPLTERSSMQAVRGSDSSVLFTASLHSVLSSSQTVTIKAT